MDFLHALETACQSHFLKLFDVLMTTKCTQEDLARFDAGLGKLSSTQKQVEHLIAAHYQRIGGVEVTPTPRDS
jgi:hypothetical protein